MTTIRIPVIATGFATCMTLMAVFLACVALWALSQAPAMHALLPYMLVGFPAVTATGVIVGLLGALIIGNALGIIFAVSFNLWNRLIGGRSAD